MPLGLFGLVAMLIFWVCNVLDPRRHFEWQATTRSMLTPYLVGIAEGVTYKLPGF